MQLTRQQFLQKVGSVLLSLPLSIWLMACTIPSNVHQPTSPAMQGNPMHISLKRTGGFTGVPLTVSVDTATLSPAESAQLQQMVETADFFQLPSTFSATPQPDRFQYQITIEEPGHRHSVTVGETAVPPNLKPLINWLMDAARQP
ncbi:MAG: protealysin inhibitor emfourin [Thermosynechococcaceae cyanobacterium]